MATSIDRRRFLQQSAGLGALAAGFSLSAEQARQDQPVQPGQFGDANLPPPTTPYPDQSPRVILVRFGGGVRRQECVLDPDRTYCPFVYHELFKRQGVLLNNVEIDQRLDVETSHGQGTLYILTGKYERYHDVGGKFLGSRFEAGVPTIFEYFRRAFAVPEHQALIINGEDRIDEEFYTFSNHHQFGVRYRSTVLSLYRFKTFLLREELANGRLVAGERRVPLEGQELREAQRRLRQMENLDYRVRDRHVVSPELDRFWENWRAYYGRTGLVNPRGDRVLTALAIRALHELRPKLLMINYQDPDYVHWGNPQFYTRAISIIDEGIREIYSTAQSIPEYRDNTVYLIVPDCGRDSNRAMPVPYQHHFNTRSAHQIFVVAAGPRIAFTQGRAVDRLRQQCSVAATVGRLMGFETPHVDAGAGVLEEVLA